MTVGFLYVFTQEFKKNLRIWYSAPMTIDDVNKLAALARMDMSDSEKQDFLSSLESILSYVGQITEVAAEKTEKKVGEIYNIVREDENPREPGTYTERVLAEAPDAEHGYFKVKKIM